MNGKDRSEDMKADDRKILKSVLEKYGVK